jgi:hypothetical protein
MVSIRLLQASNHEIAESVNPFAHLKTPSEVNTARAFFIDRATIRFALEACPDHEWRLLLALARYGGLRPDLEDAGSSSCNSRMGRASSFTCAARPPLTGIRVCWGTRPDVVAPVFISGKDISDTPDHAARTGENRS